MDNKHRCPKRNQLGVPIEDIKPQIPNWGHVKKEEIRAPECEHRIENIGTPNERQWTHKQKTIKRTRAPPLPQKEGSKHEGSQIQYKEHHSPKRYYYYYYYRIAIKEAFILLVKVRCWSFCVLVWVWQRTAPLEAKNVDNGCAKWIYSYRDSVREWITSCHNTYLKITRLHLTRKDSFQVLCRTYHVLDRLATPSSHKRALC